MARVRAGAFTCTSIMTAVSAMSALSACSPTSSSETTAQASDLGARLYGQNCVPCHREDGAGVPTVYPPLAGSSVVRGDPEELAGWVLRGERPVSMPAGRYSTNMPSFGWMKDQDAAALLSYVRSHFGNDAPPIDVATVAKAR